MASRNSRKVYVEQAFYHIYNRGVNKRRIFLDDEDYAVFLNLFKRYLSNQPILDAKKRSYPWLQPEVSLLAFCLMPNHFHLLVYQETETGFRQLLKNVCGTYTIYFNKKYQRVGPLFQDRFKASLILRDDYFQHISRYIHLNPRDYLNWPYSSLPYYLGQRQAEWLKPDYIVSHFASPTDYLKFLSDHREYQNSLAALEQELANF